MLHTAHPQVRTWSGAVHARDRVDFHRVLRARASHVMTHTHDSGHRFCTRIIIVIATLNGSGILVALAWEGVQLM